MPTRPRPAMLAGALVTVLAGTLLAACGSSSDSTSATPTSQAGTADSSALANGPYRGKTLRGTFQPDWGLPLAAEVDGKPAGFVFEIAEAAAEKLGATIKVEPNDFSTTIPGVQSGKFDIGNGTDATVERQQVVDIVSATKTGYTFLTRAGSGVTIGNSLDDLCGRRISQIAGNSVLGALNAQQAVCEQKGLQKMEILIFPDKASSFLAVQSGRADATSVYGASGGYIIKQDPSWQLAGPTVIAGETGFAVRKDSGNADLWRQAVDAVIADGTYAKILDKYGIAFIGLDHSTINPAK